LDNTDQTLSCVKGSHLTPGQTAAAGFGKISKEDAAVCEENKVKIIVPPGQWIVFFQTIAHEVCAVQRKERSMRVFFGFRLTELSEALFPNNENAYRLQGVPLIPSGQTPSMYPAMSWMFDKQRKAISEWSKATFKLPMLEWKILKKTGEKVRIVKRESSSLSELGFPLYPAYTADELAILQPIDL
jgi:hypothetical protein